MDQHDHPAAQAADTIHAQPQNPAIQVEAAGEKRSRRDKIGGCKQGCPKEKHKPRLPHGKAKEQQKRADVTEHRRQNRDSLFQNWFPLSADCQA